MGNCSKTSKQKKQIYQNPFDNLQLQNLESLQETDLDIINQIKNQEEKVDFIIQLKELKGKKLTKQNLYVELIFDNQKIVESETIQSKNPYWKLNTEFEFSTIVKNMINQTACLILKDQNHQIQSKIQLKVLELALGPIHHEYNIDEKQSQFQGKISFNLIMKQKTNLLINTTNVHIVLKEDMQYMFYKYQLKITGPKQNIKSSYSSCFKNHKKNATDKNLNQFDLDEQKKKIDIKVKECKNNNFLERQNSEQNQQQLLQQQQKKLNQQLLKQESQSQLQDLQDYQQKSEQIRQKAKNQSFVKLNESQLSQGEYSSYIESKSPRQLQLKNISNLNNERIQQVQNKKREMQWNINNENDETCKLQFQITANEFSTTALQIKVFGTNDNKYLEKSNQKELDDQLQLVNMKMVGEIYISLNKIFKHQQEYITETGKEILWLNGKNVGTVNLYI